MKQEFTHRQSAHCESGVTANLISHAGFEISEAMAFGLGDGLFFGYLPFIKINKLPLITYRTIPGAIFRRVTKRLGFQVRQQRFSDQQAAEDALDSLLEQKVPVGAQTGVFWLPYLPPAFRFHFNAHNLVVTGKHADGYRISDPLFEEMVDCPAPDLRKARFAQGALAPKGRIYWLEGRPAQIDLQEAIKPALLWTCRPMIKTPIPFSGVAGIRMLAGKLAAWPERFGQRKALLHLGHTIRMQEEIGTGGGGFRFIYAAFLQESAKLLEEERLAALSTRMTEIGDRWRDFAVLGSRVCKGRGAEKIGFSDLAEILRECADQEESFFKDLYGLAKGLK